MIKQFWLVLLIAVVFLSPVLTDAVLTYTIHGFYYTHLIDIVALIACIYLVYREFTA